MHVEKWYALVTFYADTPDDDSEADALADDYTIRLETWTGDLPGVIAGSVSVVELDSGLHDRPAEARWA